MCYCKRLIITFGCICAYFSGLAQIQDSSLIARAYTLYDENKFDSALIETNKIIAQDSTNPDYYDLRAHLYHMLGKPRMAIWDCSKSIQLQPQNNLYYSHRALYFLFLKMTDNAIKDNDSALKYANNDTSIIEMLLCERGNAKRQKRDFEGAYADYMAALKYDTLSYGAFVGLGATLDDLERSKEAIEYLKKAIKLKPDSKEGYGNLGFRYMDNGEYEKAIELFNKVLELEPEDAFGFNNRGFAKYKLKEFKEALNDINQSLEIYPDNSFAYKNRALVFLSLKEYKKACDDLKKAKELGFKKQYGDEVDELIEKNCVQNRL